jgi:hypothetical protein
MTTATIPGTIYNVSVSTDQKVHFGIVNLPQTGTSDSPGKEPHHAVASDFNLEVIRNSTGTDTGHYKLAPGYDGLVIVASGQTAAHVITLLDGNYAITPEGSGSDTIIFGSGTFTVSLPGGHGPTVLEDVGITDHEVVSGFVSGQDFLAFQGEQANTIADTLAAQITSAGNTTLTYPDGTEVTLLGISHVTASFFS